MHGANMKIFCEFVFTVTFNDVTLSLECVVSKERIISQIWKGGDLDRSKRDPVRGTVQESVCRD